MRKDWNDIIKTAIDIMSRYDTAVTLRQLFYRLVSIGLLENTRSTYSQLSSKTAEARRQGAFPSFQDRTRTIYENATFENARDAKEWLHSIYRRDRTEGQEYSIYIGVEKEGLVELLRSWFSDLGLPILALKGYSSQTYIDSIQQHVLHQDRPALLIYAGDFDPSGMDILRDFQERAACFDKVSRVGLNAEQVEKYRLPPQMGKTTDTRAKAFTAEHGELVQVELDALAPDVLEGLYGAEVFKYFDLSTYEAVLELEKKERMLLVS